MKKSLLLFFALFAFFTSNAQKVVDTTQVLDSYNKWSIEFDLGQSKGAKPYSEGYFASDPDKFLGGFQLNHYGIGVRYMFSPKFGIKSRFSYDDIKNLSGSESLPFKLQHLQLSFEGVVNAIRLFEIQDDAKRFGLLFHFGLQASQMSPISNEGSDGLGTTTNGVFTNHINVNKNKKELNGGLIVGITPAIRVLNDFSIYLDVTINSNIRQHFNWDGAYADRNNNLTGSLFTTSLGLSYSFGKEKIHGDWAIIQDKQSKEINELNNRIGEIETLMNDTDKDGVPDYLDVENNSIAGVTVDTKGRMVDKNNNGVPDELEKYIDKSIETNNSSNNATVSKGMLEKLINDGYVAAYFDSGKTQPTNASTDNIGFILNYLRNNPEKSIDIIGYADELGSSKLNTKLSSDRSQNVKAILMKAGIDSSRLNVVGNGIDNSVDKNSEYARRLVRKVLFQIK
ncbi:MAG: OmpA family protein [Flavobacterium sp.]|uniref:OmpA family protein n=1 Tax=Flavobacterium sp. TaxID=239 RepID=UPI003BE5A83D